MSATRNPFRSRPGTRRGSTSATGACPPSSMDGLGIEHRGHRRQRCGITSVTRKNGKLRVAWLPCKQLHCHWCGPRLIGDRVAHFTVCAGWQTTWAHLIDRGDWQRFRKQAHRKGIEWAKFDRRGQLLTVLTDQPLEGFDPQPITPERLEQWLTRQYKALPVGGLVRCSAAWALSNGVQHESGWRLVGVTQLPPEEVLERARQRGWDVKDDGTITPPSGQAERAFALEIGLRRPSYHGRRWWADAA